MDSSVIMEKKTSLVLRRITLFQTGNIAIIRKRSILASDVSFVEVFEFLQLCTQFVRSFRNDRIEVKGSKIIIIF